MSVPQYPLLDPTIVMALFQFIEILMSITSFIKFGNPKIGRRIHPFFVLRLFSDSPVGFKNWTM